MVWTVPGAPAMLNLMVSRPTSPAGASPDAALVLAAVIASRRVTKPSTAILSSVLVTVMTAGTDRSSRGCTTGFRPTRRRVDGGWVRFAHKWLLIRRCHQLPRATVILRLKGSGSPASGLPVHDGHDQTPANPLTEFRKNTP